ncbi:acyltransferase-domain-containing protein [Sporodiniella umbellata]|nr:acyltransferase-domain-containing protein [Sporodiniella umbellata]
MEKWSQNSISLLGYFAPCTFVFSFASDCGPLESIVKLDKKKQITRLNLPKNFVAIANHQMYVDWLYFFFIGYLAEKHGAVKIALKKSVENIPIAGWLFGFIFLNRKMANDKKNIVDNLQKAKKTQLPFWLLFFPEGTVICGETLRRSNEYAKKSGLKINRYTLVPRSAGLRLCLQTLYEEVDYLYDFTIGYFGVLSTETPFEKYSMQDIFLNKKHPKEVHVHVRRYKTSDIPVENEELFSNWITERWAEKDKLMERFYTEHSFVTNQALQYNAPFKTKNTIWQMVWPFLIIALCLCLMIARN